MIKHLVENRLILYFCLTVITNYWFLYQTAKNMQYLKCNQNTKHSSLLTMFIPSINQFQKLLSFPKGTHKRSILVHNNFNFCMLSFSLLYFKYGSVAKAVLLSYDRLIHCIIVLLVHLLYFTAQM